MPLAVVTSRGQIEEARRALERTLVPQCTRFEHWVGWQGGSRFCTVFWDSTNRFWFSFLFKARRNRHVLLIGTEDPSIVKNLRISCEINPPKSGMNRRCAGVFLVNLLGDVYVAHTGKIGGGRTGIGRSSFIAGTPAENWQTIEWPDGQRSEVLVIGKLKSAALKRQISHFADRVDAFKAERAGPTETWAGFVPEFSGKRKSYSIDTVEGECDHGLIVSALERNLRAKGLRCGNDRNRDLFVISSRRRTRCLFEVKTDGSRYAIYTAVGQLMLHAASSGPSTQKIIVLPETPPLKVTGILKSLGISVVTYRWRQEAVLFRGLERALGWKQQARNPEL